MADSKRYLIQAIYETKGWELYQTRVSQSGKVIESFQRTFTDASGKTVRATKDIANGTELIGAKATVASSQTNDFVKALRRVAIVAPVWFAFRQIMLQVFETLQAGAKQIEDLSKQLRLTQPVVRSTALGSEKAFQELTLRVRELSQETGVAVEQITKAFYRFGTLGIDFEDSIAGATESLKLSILLGGDLDQTASTLALAYKLLGDSLDKSLTPTEQFADLGAKIFKVYKTNAFLIDEFSGSLENFVSTANVSNISLNDTIALLTALSTAGIRGAKGGRLLRTSVFKLGQESKKIKDILGLDIDFEGEQFIDVLIKVIDRLDELDKAGKKLKVEEAISEIFGGVRGGQPIKALLAVRNTLEENRRVVNALGKEQTELQNEYTEAIDRSNKAVDRQLERIRNIRKFIGESWIAGAVGAENYNSALELIESTLKTVLSVQKEFNKAGLSGLGGLALPQNQLKFFTELVNKVKDIVALTRFQKGIFNVSDLEHVLNRLEKDNIEFIGVDIDKGKLREDLQNKLNDINGTTTAKVEVVYVDENGKEYKEIPDVLAQSAKATKLILPPTQDQAKILQEIVNYELKALQARGATESQLKLSELTLSKMLRINQDDVNLTKQRLDLQQAIRREREAEYSLSSKTLKLVEIAQKEGVFTAQKIGQFLQGQISFKELERLPDIFSVFKEAFPDIVKTQQAIDYLTRGVGQRIPIAEEAIRTQLLDLETQLRQDINVQFDVNVQAGDDFVDNVLDAITREVRSENSPLVVALRDYIDKRIHNS